MTPTRDEKWVEYGPGIAARLVTGGPSAEADAIMPLLAPTEPSADVESEAAAITGCERIPGTRIDVCRTHGPGANRAWH